MAFSVPIIATYLVDIVVASIIVTMKNVVGTVIVVVNIIVAVSSGIVVIMFFSNPVIQQIISLARLALLVDIKGSVPRGNVFFERPSVSVVIAVAIGLGLVDMVMVMMTVHNRTVWW